MGKRKKIGIIAITVLVILGLSAGIAALYSNKTNSASTSNENNEVSYISSQFEDSEWDDFIGEDNGKTGKVVASPEVDDMGNEVSSKTEITKSDADDANKYVKYQLDLPDNAAPEVCMDKWLEGIGLNDWIQVQLLSYGFTANQELSQSGAAHYVFEKLTWEIVEKTEDEEGLYLQLKLTTPNVKDAVADYIKNNDFDENDTNLAAIIDDDIRNIVNKADTISTELNVQLLEEEGVWKVCITEELLSAISGGLSELYTELQQEYLEGVVNP